jgi:hypothetical protein
MPRFKENDMTLRFGMVALLASLSLVTVAGCSGNDGKIEVAAASSALTDQGNDTLFTITVVEARDEGYALDSLKVKITPEDKELLDLTTTCKVTDVNANSKLDKGDTIVCNEPSQNTLGKDFAGKEIDVELFATVEGKEERVGDASYDAK